METNTTNNETSRYGHRCGHGRRPKAHWIILGILGFAALFTLGGFGLMYLWNALMPAIFHLGTVTFWQAIGLALLGRLLVGGFHHRPMAHHRAHWHRGHKECAEQAASQA